MTASRTSIPMKSKSKLQNAVVYLRVSSKDQEREGYSIPAQRKLLNDYALLNGFHVLQEFEDVETAKDTGRTHFGEMIDFMKTQTAPCRVILAEKTDRLYRNLRDWVTIDDLKLDVHLVKENEIISPDSRSSAKFMHGIRVLMAKNFIDNLSEEVKKGMLQKAREGYWPSYAPVGYMNGKSESGKKVIVPDPERAPIITMLFEAYSRGDLSLTALTKLARKLGLTHKNSGNPLARSAIHSMLQNRIYYGDFEWDGVVYTGKHEPLISRLLWQKVQDALGTRLGKNTKLVKHEFAFSGLLSCGHCGCSMVGEIKKGKYIYYHCTGFRGKCGEPYTHESTLDEQFGKLLQCLEFDAEVLEHMRENIRELGKDKNEQQKRVLDRLRDESDSIMKKLDSMYDDKLGGVISLEMFQDRAKKYRRRLDEITAEIEEHEGTDVSDFEETIELMELVRNAHSMYLRRSGSEKRRLVQNVLSNCSWKGGVLFAEFRQPYSIIADTNSTYRRRKVAGEPRESLFQMWYARQDSNL